MLTMSTPAPRAARVRRSTRRHKAYHHGDLRRALVDAALELVRDRGSDGFTLREAARRVGVSQTAPYRHFETKDALLAAVAEQGFRDLHRRLSQAAEDAGADPRLRLRAQGLAAFEYYVGDAARFRVMFGRASARKDRYPALAEAWGRVNALLLESLVASQRAGHIRDGDPLELGLRDRLDDARARVARRGRTARRGGGGSGGGRRAVRPRAGGPLPRAPALAAP